MRAVKKTKQIINREEGQVLRYFRDVSKYPMLTIEEEVNLARDIRKGGLIAEKAKTRLVEANLRFVVTVANQYPPKGMDLLDLISEGNLGLMRAADKFDETKGFKFISYAVWWIRHFISNALAENSKTIKRPSQLQKMIMQYRKANDDCMQRENRPLTIEEFCYDNGLEDKDIKRLASALVPEVSLSSPVIGEGEWDGKTTLEDILPSEHTIDNLERESRHQILEKELSSLTSKEREVIERTYGLGCDEQSLAEISFRMKISRERVRQIRVTALRKLRNRKNLSNLKTHF